MCGCVHHSTHDYSNHRRATGLAAGGAEAPAEYAPPQPATKPCPQCGALAQEDFVFCPRCGAELLTACPECHRAVESRWTHCAYCGTDL